MEQKLFTFTEYNNKKNNIEICNFLQKIFESGAFKILLSKLETSFYPKSTREIYQFFNQLIIKSPELFDSVQQCVELLESYEISSFDESYEYALTSLCYQIAQESDIESAISKLESNLKTNFSMDLCLDLDMYYILLISLYEQKNDIKQCYLYARKLHELYQSYLNEANNKKTKHEKEFEKSLEENLLYYTELFSDKSPISYLYKCGSIAYSGFKLAKNLNVKTTAFTVAKNSFGPVVRNVGRWTNFYTKETADTIVSFVLQSVYLVLNPSFFVLEKSIDYSINYVIKKNMIINPHIIASMKAASKGGMLYLQHKTSNQEQKNIIKTTERNKRIMDTGRFAISTDGHISMQDGRIKVEGSKSSVFFKSEPSITENSLIKTDGPITVKGGVIQIDGSNMEIKHNNIHIIANKINVTKNENSNTLISNNLPINASSQILNLAEIIARIKAQNSRKEVILIIEENKRIIATKEKEIIEQLLSLDEQYQKLNSDIFAQQNIHKKQYLYKFMLLQAQKIKIKFLEFCNLFVMEEKEINGKLVASHGYLDILTNLNLSSHSTSITLLDELEEFILFLPENYRNIFVENIEIFKKEISILQALEKEFNLVNQSIEEKTFFDYKSDPLYKEVLQPIKSKHSTDNLPDEFTIPSVISSYDNSKNLSVILNIILSYQAYKLSLKATLKESDNMVIANFLYEDIKQQQIDALQELLDNHAEIALAALENEYDKKISTLDLIDANNQVGYEITIKKLDLHDLSIEKVFNHEIFKLKLEMIKSGSLNNEQQKKILDFEQKFNCLLERSKSLKYMLDLKIESLNNDNDFIMKNNVDEKKSNSI